MPRETSQVAGWGVTENGTDSDYLLKAKVPVLMSRECKRKFPRFSQFPLIANDDRQICAGGELGKDTYKNKNTFSNLYLGSWVSFTYLGIDSCSGDSGGPLMSFDVSKVAKEQDAKKYLRGIVSFGSKKCGIVSKNYINS